MRRHTKGSLIILQTNNRLIFYHIKTYDKFAINRQIISKAITIHVSKPYIFTCQSRSR